MKRGVKKALTHPRLRKDRLTVAMAGLLRFGWAGLGDVAVYERLYAPTICGNLDPLRELWARHGATIKRQHRGEAFAELMLAGATVHVARMRANIGADEQ